jgi:hypothetical protein
VRICSGQYVPVTRLLDAEKDKRRRSGSTAKGTPPRPKVGAKTQAAGSDGKPPVSPVKVHPVQTTEEAAVKSTRQVQPLSLDDFAAEGGARGPLKPSAGGRYISDYDVSIPVCESLLLLCYF